ncbi:hypothetical protein NDU88_007684 [Pleurodeles waltl]|uniref:Uncharacterized protein n=1 Tax=Pleurodeles waltl TaxID=8319 RepID=A0AAV7RTX9_PLEWA|nr:hypothetical protein NDU88_007684 [Pleurodeles waltl]
MLEVINVLMLFNAIQDIFDQYTAPVQGFKELSAKLYFDEQALSFSKQFDPGMTPAVSFLDVPGLLRTQTRQQRKEEGLKASNSRTGLPSLLGAMWCI